MFGFMPWVKLMAHVKHGELLGYLRWQSAAKPQSKD